MTREKQPSKSHTKNTEYNSDWKSSLLKRSLANRVEGGGAGQARIFVVNEFSFHFTKLYTL